MERKDSIRLIENMMPVSPENTILLSREAYHHLGDEMIRVMSLGEDVIGMKMLPEKVKVMTSDFLVNGSVVIFDKNATPFCFEIDELHRYLDKDKKH